MHSIPAPTRGLFVIPFLLVPLSLHAQHRAPDPGLLRALAPSAAVVKVGNQAPLMRFNRHLSGGGHTWNGSDWGWQITHSLAVLAGNPDAKDRFFEQIRFSLRPENCFTASGGYAAQHELGIMTMYSLLRLDNKLWEGELTAAERHKIELLMRAAVVASAFTTSDASYDAGRRVTGIDGDRNLSRGWNPNFREGMFGGLIAGSVFFGGTEAVTRLLDTFDHAAFVAELKAAGLDNTVETFTLYQTKPDSGAPSPEMVTRHIRNYRYQKEPLASPMRLLHQLSLHTFGREVNCGLNDGKGILVNGVACGIIAAGCDQLPNRGKPGMLLEFDGVDGSGKRSSITYAISGFRPNLANHVLVLVGGYWEKGAAADEILARMAIGIPDLEYKLTHGYRSYHNGKGQAEPFTMKSKNWNWIFQALLPWWNEKLKVFHGL